jgi:ArsR family transcriptional regulator
MGQFCVSGNDFRLDCRLQRNSMMTPGARLTSAISEAELSALDAPRNRHPVSTATPPAHVLTTAGDLLRALSAPVRIAIVVQLCESSRCVHELVDTLGLPQPLVSQHLRILKAAGVVAGDRAGREVRYRLVDTHLADIVVAAVTHAAEGR